MAHQPPPNKRNIGNDVVGLLFAVASFVVLVAILANLNIGNPATPAPTPNRAPIATLETISEEEMAKIVNLEATLANLRCGEVRMLPLPDSVILANGEVRLQTICFRLGNLETDQTLNMVIERQVLVTYDDKAGRIFVVITAKGTTAWLGTAPGVERTELDSSALLKVTGLNAYVNEYRRKAKTVEFDLNRATGAISNVVLTDGAE